MGVLSRQQGYRGPTSHAGLLMANLAGFELRIRIIKIPQLENSGLRVKSSRSSTPVYFYIAE
jgi:hypothetical protein